jgi:acetyltransferase-like isoleucine patch superfamily enzyme
MEIRKIIKKVLGMDNGQRLPGMHPDIERYCKKGAGTIFQSLIINVRMPEERKYLVAGNDSVVSGNFIFENKNGNVLVGDRTFIGGGDFISINTIEVGSDVLISWGCTFMDNNAHSLRWEERKNDVLEWKKGIEQNKIGFYKNWEKVKSAPIKIMDKAWIGFNCTVLKGVTIGTGAIVGAGSIVTGDIPEWTIVAGNPAKVIREIPFSER